tara:strand:+ start:202 stop:372 length:171 start_codon:yes stop_codon:yes gene_type:complete
VEQICHSKEGELESCQLRYFAPKEGQRFHKSFEQLKASTLKFQIGQLACLEKQVDG